MPRCAFYAFVFIASALTCPSAWTKQEIASDAPALNSGPRNLPKSASRTPPGTAREDPRARLDAQREDRGIISAASLENIRHQRRGRRSEPKSAVPGTPSAAGTGPSWVPIGPTGADYEQNGISYFQRDSGRARRILPHPTDANTVYFLTSGGGLWVSHDFSAAQSHWTPLTDFLSTTSGGSVAFGRTPGVLYLGTGDPFDVVNVGGSMVKSIDGGTTWGAEFDLGSSDSVRDVAVDISTPTDIVLVATDFGFYRSTDGGATYVLTASGPGGPFEAKSMWNVVQTSAGWLASAQACSFKPATSCGTAGQLYISTDHAATWNPIPNIGGVFTGAGRTSLAVAVPGDAVVYAFAENAASTDQLDLFRSSDGGLNWTALNINGKVATNSNSDAPNMNLMNDQAFYNQMVVVDPRDAARNTVYIGGDLASAKSLDGGNTWTLLTDWLLNAFCSGPVCAPLPYAHADFHTGVVSTAGGSATLMFGNDGGLAVSTNDGATWSSDKNNGLQTFLFYSLASTPKFPNAMFGGTQDNGTRVRKGNTSVFNQSAGGDGIGTGWSQANAFAAISSFPNNEFITNLGNQIPELLESWIRTTPPLASDAVFYTSLATPAASADPTGKVFFTSSQQQVYRTGDGALTWNVIGHVGTTIPASFFLRSGPHAVEVSPVDLSHIGVIGGSGEVHFTTDAGATWSNRSINTLLPGFQSFTKSIAWATNQTVYVTSISPTPGAIRVAKSVDGGATWARADGGLPDVPVSRIILDGSDPTHATLLAATDVGVFRSTNGGAIWQAYGSGLPSVSVTDLYMPPDGSFLRIATYGRGIWQLPALSFVSAALTDDGLSCDHDGVLDNGESGHLAITLRNDGGPTLSAITATISSAHPNVSFPAGNGVTFPSASSGATTTASVPVALNGAVGVQQIDFAISFNDSSLTLPTPASASASFRANYDEVPSGSGNDTEARTPAWTVTGAATATPVTLNWQRREISPLEHRWVEVDSMTATDNSLVSPTLNVGSGPFTLSFEQRYRFSANGTPGTAWYDGMVLEASNNGGSSWVDVGASASPGYDHTIASGYGNVLQGRLAYAGSSTGYPAFVPVTLNLGTQFAGQQVQLRFRVATNFFGYGPGVELRNIVASGIANTPFTSVVAHRGFCSPAMTSVNAATFTVNSPGTFTVTATGNPAPSFSISGALPSGVTFAPGTGVLAGPPALGTVGSHPLTINASNGVLPNDSQAFTLTVQKANQVIAFTNPGSQNFSTTPVPLAATAAPGLVVAFTSNTAAVCTVSASNVTMVTAGTCTIAASQLGDANYNAAAPAQQSFSINAVAPGAPTIGAATAGNNQAFIAFTPPAFGGGSPISGYTVACLPGPVTVSGSVSPVTVSPLANGIAYSCSVKAINSAGSSASSGTVSVTPQPATYSLSVSTSGNGFGTVTSTPSGISCGATCVLGFAPGTVVTLAPAPSPNSAFSAWGGDCSGTGACQVTMNALHNVSATFILRISPDPFTFIDQVNVQPNTLVTSNAVTMSGLGAVASVVVTGGSYSIGCTADFTTAAGTITNGQTVCVRHTTPPALTTTTNTTLTVGSTSDTFSSTTAATLDPLLDADGDGIPNSVEPVEGRNPLVKDNDVFANARLFAMQQYRDFLNREGDSGGIGFWTTQINTAAQTRGQCVENFFNSAEFQSTVAPVARLYFAYFLRIPDYAGLQFWINFYKSGHALDEISNAFAGSPEFASRYGALTNSQFVTLVYQNVLGRNPDSAGLAFWTGQLDSAARTRGQVMLGFSESAEYQSTSFNKIYVTMMYVGMLRRAPDQGGFDFWVGYLGSGNSGLALINGFLAAPEYHNRFLP